MCVFMEAENKQGELIAERMRAVHMARKLSIRLIANHGEEIRSIYLTPNDTREALYQDRDPEPHRSLMEGRWIADIAERFVDDNPLSKGVTHTAVQFALADLVDDKERDKELIYRTTLVGLLRPKEELSKAGKIGGKNCHKLHPGHRDVTLTSDVIANRNRAYWNNLSQIERDEWLDELTVARGHTSWEDMEIAYAMRLTADKSYVRSQGSNIGGANFEKIATEINRVFGNNRTPNATRAACKAHGYIRKGLRRFSEEERDYVSRLLIDPNYRHMSGRFAGHPDYNKMTSEFNKKFGIRIGKKSIESLGQYLSRMVS